MKKYYRWSSSERFRTINGRSQEFKDFVFNEIVVSTQKIKHLWKPFPFRFDEKKKKFSDFPFLNTHLYAISERALVVLKDMIDHYVEILPLNIENSDLEYYAMNVIQTYDIDVARSDFFDNTDPVSVFAYAFPDDILPQAPIFKLTDDIQSGFTRTYVSEEFREIVETNKLVGLLFDEEMKYQTERGNSKQIGSDTEGKEINEITSSTPRKIYQIRKTKSSTIFKHYPIKDIGPPITKKMLIEFEKNFPRALPEDYRDFLQQCNGGTMDEKSNAFYIHGIRGFTETSEGDEGIVAWFDSLNPNKENEEEDLLSQYLSIRGEGVFPDYCLPIGSDYGGNLILLSLGGGDYGHIYYWDHELGWGEAGSLEPDYSHCYHAANSFTELINSLHSSLSDHSDVF